MAYFIPSEKIDEIRRANDIVDVISTYVNLKKRGKNYFGLCPFHSEKTPSFSVNREKDMFHCFGCGKGGNVFTFLMELEHMGFYDAVKMLAERAGIELPERVRSAKGETIQSLLFDVNRKTARFYHDNLLSSEGKHALEYLKNRGIGDDAVKSFGLGYAPDKWEGLLTHLKIEEVKVELIEKAGLVLKRESGGYYDRFRNRIIFPIINLSGRVAGFGARALEEAKDIPKYINTPETPVYHKSRILYGLYKTREEIRSEGTAVLVEGYTDFISLYQAGIRNVVAVSGTSLTEQHAEILSRYTDNVIIFYDSDNPGRLASIRAGTKFLIVGMEVRVVELPQGFDPDSFVRKFPISSVKKAMDSAVPLLDFRIALNSERLKRRQDKARFINEVLEDLSGMRDPIMESLILRDFSEKMGVSERVLYSEFGKYRKKSTGRPGTVTGEYAKSDGISFQTAGERAQYELLRLFIHSDSMRKNILSRIKPPSFSNEHLRELFVV
ncbi:MAG: DNA primase, partial [Fidelibacterota bacterium]